MLIVGDDVLKAQECWACLWKKREKLKLWVSGILVVEKQGELTVSPRMSTPNPRLGDVTWQHGEREFADVRYKDFEMEFSLDYLGRPNLPTESLKIKKGR